MDLTEYIPYIPSLFVTAVVIAVLETIIRLTRPQLYFRTGILLAKYTLPQPISKNTLKHLAAVYREIHPLLGELKTEIVPLTDSEIGLRVTNAHLRTHPNKTSKRYNPVTHAYIKTNSSGQEVKLTVYLNWMVIPFALLWFGGALFFFPLWLKIALTALGAFVIYKELTIELRQYHRVLEAAASKFVSG